MENNRVRKASSDGIITTVDGTSEFAEPSGVAVDGNGNLYVISPWADVSKVSPSGMVLTVPGTGFGCTNWPTSPSISYESVIPKYIPILNEIVKAASRPYKP